MGSEMCIRDRIYYPQANGLIERDHQTVKNSIKAMLIDLGDTYQENWLHYLPWALLGIRSSFNKDLGTSPAEMCFGMHPQLPGTILADPDDVKIDKNHTATILRKLQMKNNRLAVPTSINKPNPTVPDLPDNVSHVYARLYTGKGLSSKYLGPLPVISRPTRSTIQLNLNCEPVQISRNQNITSYPCSN